MARRVRINAPPPEISDRLHHYREADWFDPDDLNARDQLAVGFGALYMAKVRAHQRWADTRSREARRLRVTLREFTSWGAPNGAATTTRTTRRT